MATPKSCQNHVAEYDTACAGQNDNGYDADTGLADPVLARPVDSSVLGSGFLEEKLWPGKRCDSRI